MKVYIAKIEHVSLVDIVGEPCAVVWFSFCNFRCPWCFDRPIVTGEIAKEMEVDDLVNQIKYAKIAVDYVQALGGEPTVQDKALFEFLSKCKKIGFKCSITTNGSRPDVIKKLIDHELLDHVAMDLKAPLSKPEKYLRVIGLQDPMIINKIQKSLELIIKNVKFCEIRTTVIPDLTDEDILEIAKTVANLKQYARGRVIYILQQFQPTDTLVDKRYSRFERTPEEKLIALAKKISNLNLEVYIRSLSGIKKL